MPKSPLVRALAAACTCTALLTGCARGPDGGAESNPDSASAATTSAPAPSTLDAENNASATVVFHISGLMLVVPTQGGQTHVLMPRVTRHPDPHVARFAFGLEWRDTDLCRPYRGGICWVDLKDWRMEPIGGGGSPQTSRPFPDTIINVTRATGGLHRVKLDPPEQQLVAHLRFESGTLGEMPCSLARWKYLPAGQTDSVTAPFANVMRWEIQHPRTDPLTLRFIRKSDGLQKTVQLGTTTSGRVHVLLVHVPDKELPDLESGRTTGSPADTQPLHHLHDMYDHLHDPGGQPATNRPVPRFAGEIRPLCPVAITLFDTRKKLAPLRYDGIKTYGCVVGTGEG